MLEPEAETRTGAEQIALDDACVGLPREALVSGVDVAVHEPPELIEHLRTLARRLRRATSVAR